MVRNRQSFLSGKRSLCAHNTVPDNFWHDVPDTANVGLKHQKQKGCENGLVDQAGLNPGLAGNASVQNMRSQHDLCRHLWLSEQNSLDLSQPLSHHHLSP